MMSSVVSAARAVTGFLVRVVPDGEVARDVQIVPRDDPGDGEHAAAKRLAENHDVGFDPVVVEGEHAACFAKTRRDFIHDQQRTVLAARGLHRLPVARRGHDWNGAHRFGDDGGHIAFAGKRVFDHFRTGQCAGFRARMAVGAVVAMEWSDVFRARQ